MLPRHKQNTNQSNTGMNNNVSDESFSSQTSSNASNYQMQYQNKTNMNSETSLKKSNSNTARYHRQQQPQLYATKSYASPPPTNIRPFPQTLDQRSKSFNYGQTISHQNQNFNPLSGNIPILQKKPSGNSVKEQFTSQSWQQQQSNAPSKYPTKNPSYKMPHSNQAYQNQKQQQQRNQYQQENGQKPLVRSQTTVNRNMQKYEITIDLNDYGVKTNNAMMTTYQQQQQYNKSLKMTSNLRNMLFYGPNKYHSLVYVGQNPALKNYLRLRRLKHEELILKKTSNESVGMDSNDQSMSSDGFIKINVSGNRRLDNPEEYSQLNKNEIRPKSTNFISKSSPENEKGPTGFKKMFKLFKNNNNDSKKSNKRPATISNTPPLVINLPEPESDAIKVNLPRRSPSPTKHSTLSQTPQNKLLHNSVTSTSSEKGLDLLLDTVLKAHEGDSDSESETILYHSPASFSPPALSHLNAFMSLNDGFNMNRRDSINSLSSNNSSSRNSIRSLSYTNLQKLRLLQNEDETEKDKILERLFTAFTEVRIFDEPRKKWIVYKGKHRDGRANLAKMIDLEDDHGKKSLNFSNKVEVFQLPENSDDTGDDEVSESEELGDSEEELMSLTEEELLKLKSMKELEIFQQIKTEINDFKSFEMLVHKDSILNTHFFM